MSRGPCTFRQQDVTRALKATVAAGLNVQRVQIGKDGKIIIETGKPEAADRAEPNEWDSVNDTDQA